MRVLIAGDFCPCDRGQKLIDSESFSNNFTGIGKLTEGCDFSIVNFETNISTNKSKPIKKNGPSLTTNEKSLDLIKYLGFNVVTLANNHFYDYGDDAVKNTLKCLDSEGIKHVGGGVNIAEARKILFLSKNDETLAVINACEHEFSIADDEHGGSYGVNPVQLFYDIQDAREKADYVLVVIHGGHELYQLPSVRMQEWYRFFIDAGADAVINHHQHCYSGMEVYKNKPIYYGLGNFYFDDQNQKEKSMWNEGILVILNFSQDEISHEVIPFDQCVDKASISVKYGDENFLAKFQVLNEIIKDDKSLLKNNQEFYSESKRNVLGYFQPFWGKLLMYAYNHNYLPSLLCTKKLLSILNMVECEAHLDKLKIILRDNLKI